MIRSPRASGSASSDSSSWEIFPRRCSRSQGAAANCTLWVCSCRATQSRKSSASTFNSRSMATMFGATRTSRPPGGTSRRSIPAKGSYWPSTFEERKARMAPISTPVAVEERIWVVSPIFAPRLCASERMAGSSSASKLCTFARAQPGRSTISTWESRRSLAASSPVIRWTWSTAASALRRRSATTSAICAPLSFGPAPTSVAAVLAASSQLISRKSVVSMFPIPSRLAADGADCASSKICNARNGFGSAAAASGQVRCRGIEGVLVRGQFAVVRVDHEGEGKRPAVPGDRDAGEA